MEVIAAVVITMACMTIIFIGVMKIIERAHEKEIKILEEENKFNRAIRHPLNKELLSTCRYAYALLHQHPDNQFAKLVEELRSVIKKAGNQ